MRRWDRREAMVLRWTGGLWKIGARNGRRWRSTNWKRDWRPAVVCISRLSGRPVGAAEEQRSALGAGRSV